MFSSFIRPMDFISDLLNSSDRQSRLSQERINLVEKLMGDLCFQFASYARTMGKLRHKGDVLARSILKFAESENFNLTLRNSLISFAGELSCMQDYREVEVKRLEAKVIEHLSAYGTICKHARDNIRANVSIKSKEVNRKHQLEKIQKHTPTISHGTSLVENEYWRGTFDCNWLHKVLEEQVNDFEYRKISDIKALEILTRAYGYLQEIDEKQDLEEFRNRTSHFKAVCAAVIPSKLGLPIDQSQNFPERTQVNKKHKLQRGHITLKPENDELHTEDSDTNGNLHPVEKHHESLFHKRH
ncbi:protein FAM92A-B-like isoform X2 [Limulus polyphemus]|uniref:Protein FAM92A-B-like isoform X2 n=1 Tax=Limulus polyphemus TaxID=6850 RepID=A0ABM1SS36_LIMPO|nr:protein FAM92A-B-like isoform X2 [Limulus polyphemus]